MAKGFEELRQALDILERNGGSWHNLCAEHDVIHCCVYPGDVPEDDTKKLDALGWHVSDDGESFRMFT